MDVYLIRHADALRLEDAGVTDDADRPLSDLGERQSESMGSWFKARGFSFDRIVSSPYLRAKQTAEIMLRASGIAGTIEFSESLTPNARCKKTASYLMKTGGERVALVGHLPHMATFAAWTIGAKKAQIEMAKAGVALISSGDSPIKGNGVLQWLITPEWF